MGFTRQRSDRSDSGTAPAIFECGSSGEPSGTLHDGSELPDAVVTHATCS